MFDSERYPLNLCLVKNKLDIHVLFLKMENLNLWFLYNGDFCVFLASETTRKLLELIFYSGHIIDQIRVHWIRIRIQWIRKSI